MELDRGMVRRTAGAVVGHMPGARVALTYERRWLRRDLLAGLVLTALLVPEGMAYAELAGLPAVTGLYTTVVALAAYAVFGPSRNLVVGPDSALGPLIAATILPLVGARGDPSKAIALAGTLALVVGLLCLVAGFARLGILAELMSKPVRIGLLNGIALVAIVSQLPALFGFATRTDGLEGELTAFVDGVRAGRIVVPALLIGAGSVLVIVVLRLWRPRVPGILVAVVLAAVVTAVLDLPAHGVAVVGAVPGGFPAPSLPGTSWHNAGALVLAATGMAFVILADTVGLSRSLAARRGESADANGELVAMGIANASSALFQGFPSSASVTRTAVAESAGARTQLAGLVGALLTLSLLVSGSGLGRNLPQATLAAIVIVAACVLFDVASLRWLWKVRPSELTLSVVTFLAVAVLGVLEGVGVAIVVSLADFLRRAWRPHDAVLGRVAGRKGYHDVLRHPEAAQIPGLVLYRFDAPIFFANADYFLDRLAAVRTASPDSSRWVIVAAEPVTDIDSTGAESIGRLLDELGRDGVNLAFAELKGPVKDRLRAYGLYDRIGERNFFPTIGTAVHAYLTATSTPWTDWEGPPDDPSSQTEPGSAGGSRESAAG
jgi:high affinity sulfate transporter 1